MKVIIMGCGRVGEQLARLRANEDHHIVVIDQDATALARLGSNFKGEKITGVGFDRDVLLKAGIEHADAFAAASSSDNANIVAARIAHNIFHVPRVVARLFDPRRAEIYRRLGMLTISSTTWGAERIRELLTSAELDPILSFGSGEVSLVNIEIPPHLVGRMVKDLVVPNEIVVVAITRQGAAFIPTLGSQFKEDDIIQVAIQSTALERFKLLIGLSEGG
ncbi:MAG: potassium transporter TrkA [Chloroflexi bacterium RBG_16_54_11]|nr:MAG: potassium transporter TrkA [Chloroflexi bacterium RBG_16_54_11]